MNAEWSHWWGLKPASLSSSTQPPCSWLQEGKKIAEISEKEGGCKLSHIISQCRINCSLDTWVQHHYHDDTGNTERYQRICFCGKPSEKDIEGD